MLYSSIPAWGATHFHFIFFVTEYSPATTLRTTLVSMDFALVPNLRVDSVSAAFTALGDTHMMSVVRELPPRASCSNRVSLESRYGTCDDDDDEEEEVVVAAVMVLVVDDPEDDDAEAAELVKLEDSAAVSAETTFPSAESDLLMPHASSSLDPLAPDLETFSHPARSTRYSFEMTASPPSEETPLSRQSATIR